jgi:hypothetical protein
MAEDDYPSTPRNSRFTAEETLHFLDVMESVCPIGLDEWEQVATAHAKKFNTGRTYESLRRKYNSLANKKMSTGDPKIPPDLWQVMKAKKITSLIFKRSVAALS